MAMQIRYKYSLAVRATPAGRFPPPPPQHATGGSRLGPSPSALLSGGRRRPHENGGGPVPHGARRERGSAGGPHLGGHTLNLHHTQYHHTLYHITWFWKVFAIVFSVCICCETAQRRAGDTGLFERMKYTYAFRPLELLHLPRPFPGASAGVVLLCFLTNAERSATSRLGQTRHCGTSNRQERSP